MTVVLTPVQTKQIRINIHKRKNQKHGTNSTKHNTVNRSEHIIKTHTHTETHTLKNQQIHTHTQAHYKTHINTHTHYKTHTYTQPQIKKLTHT